MNKINLDVEKAYSILSKEKDKSGRYFKTLFHIHTPESHDYRLFSCWANLKENEFLSLSTNEYINKLKASNIFPKEFFETSLQENIFTENFTENGFADPKEQLAYLTLAQSLYTQNIALVIVTDHNSIKGIKKLKKAVHLLSNLPINKKREYIEIINGIEISCADKLHVVAIFNDSKIDFINRWLNSNLMNEKTGSFRSSLDVFESFQNENIFTYIAHINSSDIFNKHKSFSGAYKKQLFSQKYSKYIGISDISNIQNTSLLLSEYSINAHFILDNDSHVIEELTRNTMWVKCSKRNYEQLVEALLDYDISISLTTPTNFDKRVIKGIYIPDLSDAFLSSKPQSNGFILKFSESLNCFIGGRGTGKSTVLDLIQFVLSQKFDTQGKLYFLAKHYKTYILYILNNKEYIIELNLPNDNTYIDTFVTKYKTDTEQISNTIKKHYLTIYEINGNNINKVTKNKDALIEKMFDTKYSVNDLVNSTREEKISDYLYDFLFKNKSLKKIKFNTNLSKISNILSATTAKKEQLKSRKQKILSTIQPFNEKNKNTLEIKYHQNLQFNIPYNFDTWFFPDGRNLKKPFKNFKITHHEILDFLLNIFQTHGFEKFIHDIIHSKITWASNPIITFAKNSQLYNNIENIDLIEINHLTQDDFYKELLKVLQQINLIEVKNYLKKCFENSEILTLNFNINSKVTDKDKKALFKSVDNLSLGQKVVAMLDFTLAYSEHINDYRPLLIDQPEDNLDSRYIYTTLVEELRKTKSKRQIIIATHNATIVTNSMADLVILMESDGEKGWVEKCGYPSDNKIKKHIINYLEGGTESFEHKVKIYKEVITITQ